jgi:hypothetical protein
VAKASFFVNNLKVTKKGDFLVLEAQMKCKQGKVFDEVHLTLPGQLARFFTSIEGTHNNTISGDGFNDTSSLAERFKRFSNGN